MTHPGNGAGAPETILLRVRRVAWESDGVVSVALERPDRGALPGWEPGAHIDVDLRPGLTRQYSLCGAPGDASIYEFAVLREDGGRGGSRFVHDTLRPGMSVGVRGPRNHFPLVDAGGYLFVAGGVGITPLLPMIEAVQAAGRRWRLLYAGRDRDRMAFLDRLTVHDDRVTLAASADGERLDLAGWFTHAQLRVPGAHVYCCGPERMLDEVIARGAETGIPVHLERFAVPEQPVGAVAAGAFRVELARSGSVLDVGAEDSILDRLLGAGFDVQNDCRDGICGSCTVGVLGGEPDHRDYVLTEKERRESRSMMVCVSRCRGERLVLDL